jgi:hypothetical protein
MRDDPTDRPDDGDEIIDEESVEPIAEEPDASDGGDDDFKITELQDEDLPADDEPSDVSGADEFVEEEIPLEEEVVAEAPAEEAEVELELDETESQPEPLAAEDRRQTTEVRRRGVGERYARGSKPPSRARKRVTAALILSLPVILIGLVVAGFFLPGGTVNGQKISAWGRLARNAKLISDEPAPANVPPEESRPSIAPAPAEPKPPHPMADEYHRTYVGAIKNVTEADVLRDRMKAEQEQLSLAEPSAELKQKYFEEVDRMVGALEAADAKLKELMTQMEADQAQDIPRQRHTENLQELLGLLTGLRGFRSQVKPAALAAAPKERPAPPPADPPPLAKGQEPEPPPKEPKPAEPEPPPKEPTPAPQPKPAPPKEDPPPVKPEKPEPAPQEPAPEPKKEEAPAPATPKEETPAVQRREGAEPKSADVLAEEAGKLVLASTAAILKLARTPIPQDTTSRLELKLEAEDAMAGLDDAESKFIRALKGLESRADRADDARKIRENLERIRQLRLDFNEGFLRRLDGRAALR